MKLKNLDLFVCGTIGIFVSIDGRVFIIECDSSSLDLFIVNDIEVTNVMVFSDNDVYVYLAHSRNTIETSCMIELINIAFDNNLDVFDNDLELLKLGLGKITKEDFQKFLESRE